MPPPKKFIVVCRDEDTRMLYFGTITRKFPQAAVTYAPAATTLPIIAKDPDFAAAVIHFDGSPEIVAIARALRTAQPNMPIVALSYPEFFDAARTAGASDVMSSDAWLSVGPLLQQRLTDRERASD